MQINFFNFKVRGIDISAYDLKLLVDKLVGKVHFVICRIGHGTKTDVKFKEFWAALKGKIFRLTYFYLDYYSNYMKEFPNVYGKSDYEWGVIQGNNAWNNLKDDHDTKLTYLDIEQGDTNYAPDIDTVWPRVEAVADGFFETYDILSGLINGIYASLSRFKWFSQRFRHRPAYVAWYDEDNDGKVRTRESVIAEMRKLGWTGPIHFWQFASDGDTGTDGIGDGIEFGLGRPVMDLDIWMGTEEEWLVFRKQGGTMDNILLNISPIAQRNPLWANEQLGTSNKTIGSHGCTINCATMLLRLLLGINITPAELNTWLKANGGYQNYNLFDWYILEKFDPRISFRYRYKGAYLDKIDEQLQKGIPSIVNVDMNPATSVLDEHWVLVVGKVDGSYIINDPWYGTQFKFEEKYGDPRTGVKIVSTYNFDGIPGIPEVPLFQVKVLIPNLLIRKGPAKTYGTYGVYAKGIYDIYEEKNGYYRFGIDRWISADPTYTQKLGGPIEPTDSQKLMTLWAWYKETHPG